MIENEKDVQDPATEPLSTFVVVRPNGKTSMVRASRIDVVDGVLFLSVKADRPGVVCRVAAFQGNDWLRVERRPAGIASAVELEEALLALWFEGYWDACLRDTEGRLRIAWQDAEGGEIILVSYPTEDDASTEPAVWRIGLESLAYPVTMIEGPR